VTDANACFIDGVAYAAGTANPGNACQVCAPGTSITAWSSQADACGTGQACVSGTCVPASASIRLHCGAGQPGDTILETVSAAACVNLSSATVAAGPSFVTLQGAGSVTLYEGADCTGGKLQVSANTSFCGLTFDPSGNVNDNVRSISFP
jgi:hypothetical protein